MVFLNRAASCNMKSIQKRIPFKHILEYNMKNVVRLRHNMGQNEQMGLSYSMLDMRLTSCLQPGQRNIFNRADRLDIITHFQGYK